MLAEKPVPLWLWRFAVGALTLAVLGPLGLALGLAQGWADPPRAGLLAWQDDFKGGLGRWTVTGPLAVENGALQSALAGSAAWAMALTPAPAGDFTLEVAATQTTGEVGQAYGVVFGWQAPDHYSAILVNGNGYAEAYTQRGPERVTWFPWQQWPHLLFGYGTNRVRVDVRGPTVTVRLNDEWLVEFATDPSGQMGVYTRAAPGVITPSTVVFSWARLWATP